MNQPQSDNAGFALFETIVALALASLALSAIYRSTGESVRATSVVRMKAAGLSLARTHLGSLAGDGVLPQGISSGVYENGLRWRLSVAPLAARADQAAAQPVWIVLETFDRRGGVLVKLETARVVREAQ